MSTSIHLFDARSPKSEPYGIGSRTDAGTSLRMTLIATAMLIATGAQAATTANRGQCSVAALQPFAPVNTKLLNAQLVTAGTTAVSSTSVTTAFPLPASVPEYCLVEGNIATPLNNEGVGFQVLIPTAWNEKFAAE